MAFSDGFSSGLQLGRQIKQNKLDRKAAESREKQLADDLKERQLDRESRSTEAAASLKQQTETENRRFEAAATQVTADNNFRNGRAAADDARASELAKQQARQGIMNDIREMGQSIRNNRLDATNRSLIGAQIENLRAKSAGSPNSAYTQDIVELDPDTGIPTSRRTITRRAGAPAAETTQPQPKVDPNTAMKQAVLDTAETEKANAEIDLALNGNRSFTSPSTWLGSGRQGTLDAATKKVSAVQGLMPQSATPAAAAMGAAPPAAPAPGAQRSAQPPAPGTIARQNGIAYRFDGRTWTQIP